MAREGLVRDHPGRESHLRSVLQVGVRFANAGHPSFIATSGPTERDMVRQAEHARALLLPSGPIDTVAGSVAERLSSRADRCSDDFETVLPKYVAVLPACRRQLWTA